MDWDTLTDFQWGSVETEFMTVAKFSPEVRAPSSYRTARKR
jgi:hypothetical protein